MSRIIESLKQAVRFARGDKSAGKVTVVHVPVVTGETALGMARNDQGQWVAKEDVHPHTNVYGRVYRSEAGRLGVYYGAWPGDDAPVAWFFPRAN